MMLKRTEWKLTPTMKVKIVRFGLSFAVAIVHHLFIFFQQIASVH